MSQPAKSIVIIFAISICLYVVCFAAQSLIVLCFAIGVYLLPLETKVAYQARCRISQNKRSSINLYPVFCMCLIAVCIEVMRRMQFALPQMTLSESMLYIVTVICLVLVYLPVLFYPYSPSEPLPVTKHAGMKAVGMIAVLTPVAARASEQAEQISGLTLALAAVGASLAIVFYVIEASIMHARS